MAYGFEHPEQGPLNTEDFSGGPETIEALRAAGFELERKDAMADELRSQLERVLAEYETARVEQVYGAASPMWSLFKELGERLERTPPVLSRTALSVSWSVGAGTWARVPWISFLDSHETDTTQRGVYPALLFRQDLTGVYLTLAQGVTEPKKTLGRPAAVAYLQGRAQRVRDRSPELTSWGFALDGNIDLHADPGLGKDYEVSTIAHKLYERGDVPPDDEIIDDLDAVLRAYDNYIESRGDELGPLAALAEEFRETRPYPSDSDKGHAASREELAEGLSSETLTAVEADPSAWELVRFSHFAGSAYGGPGPQSSVHTGVMEGGDAAKAKLARTLRYLLYETEVGEAQRIDDLLGHPDWKVFGLAESLAIKALAVVYPDRWIPVFLYGGSMGKKVLSQSPSLGVEPLDEAHFDTSGKQAVESNRRLKEVLEPLFPEDAWAQGQFLYWLRDRERAEITPQIGLQALAGELLLDQDWLADTVELLRDKRQIIFYGPPGTGKTYVARKLAEYIAQDPGRVEIVQFHPSYAYEDFVEGYRPTTGSTGGSVQFDLSPGPLRRFAKYAADSESDWCLLIDEINRGNIAKIFGELYYLLEYRDEEIRLQYGGKFSLPKNLYIIGTMNTADRSIALLDAALRRRFHFVPFFPDQPPIKGLLRRWLKKNRPEMEYVAGLVDKANAMLPDRHLQIGPSHFMTLRLDADWLAKVWRGSVLPYIEEQFFDEPERVAPFRLETLTGTLPSAAPPEDQEGGVQGDDETPASPVAGVETDPAGT